MIEIEVRTTVRRQLRTITSEVQRVVGESGVGQGLCHVHIPHTTAAVVINENADPDVPRDLLAAYETLIPNIRFAHSEGNSDAHFLSTVLGCGVTVPVENGRLLLGTWQGIFFVELDGPRTRRVWVTVIP
jgi:secondary thiamine-phosphate synthase enzyme